MKIVFLSIILIFILAFFFCCSSDNVFTDERDGKTYETIKIGEQIWMRKNLNYEADGSKCYDNEARNCKRYGRLYNWETAMKVCPNGWHLPSKDEWDILSDLAGDDTYGFRALNGGVGHDDGRFGGIGNMGYWWSANENNSSAHLRGMYYNGKSVIRWWGDKSNLVSVRCLKD